MRVPDENFGPDTPTPRAPILGPDGSPNVDPGADLPVQNTSNTPAPEANDKFPVERPALQDLHQQFQDSDADRNAKVIQISRMTGKPPALVDQHFDQAQKAANTPRSSFFQTVEDQYPGTTKFLSDPANMAVSKDDIPNLALHERILRGISDAWNAEKNSFTAGALEEELGFTRYQQLSGEPVGTGDSFRLGSSVAARAGITETDPEKRAQLLEQKIQELSSQVPQNQNFLEKGLSSFARFAPQIAGAVGYGSKYGIPAAGVTAAATIETGPGEILTVPTAYGVAQTAGNLDYAFKYMTGVQYNTLKNTKLSDGSPLPDNVAKVASVATGAAAAGLSLVKLGAILDTIPGGKEFFSQFEQAAGQKILENSNTYRNALSNFAKNYIGSVAHFTGAMVGITAANKIGVEAAKTAAGDTSVTESPEKVLGDFGQTIQDAVLTGGVAGLPGTLAGAGWEVSRARQAEATKQGLMLLGEASKDSKTLQRMPEAFQQFVKEVTKDGPVQDVHVPIEAFQTYFQDKKIDPAQVADELGVIKAYQEAVQTGGDVKIPLETWAQKIGPTEHLAGLADNVRFRPDEMTVREKQQAEAEAKDAFAKLAGDQEKVAQTVKADESAQRIHDEIQSQLKAAGLTPAEVRVNPQLQAAFFKTLGDKLGVDPYELYGRYPLTIQKTDKSITAPEEHVLEQAKHIEGTNVVDAFSEFRKRSADAGVEPPQPKAKSAIAKVVSKVRGSLGHPGLDSIEARYPKGKRRTEIRKGLKEAQQPDAGPYVTDKRSDFSWFPNYDAKPTGVIGPDRIAQPHDTSKSGAEVDPLGWGERKYGATHELIQKHAQAEMPLTINTSSDLVATQGYLDALPPDTTVRMHLLTKSEHLNRLLFPGNPSRARQMAAVNVLREGGINVEEIRPTVDGVISSAGGLEKAMAATGETEQGLREFIAKNIGLHAVPDGKTYEQAGPKGGAKFDHLSESVPVIRLSPSAEARSAEGNPKELGKIAVDAARSKRGEPIVNQETSEPILLSGESLNKELKRTHDVATATALEHIDTLLAEAHYGGEHETLKSNDSASDYRYFYAPIEVDGKAYNAKITVRVDQQPVKGGGTRDHLVYDALSVNGVRRPEGANGVLNPSEGATASGYNEPPAISKTQFVDEYNQVRQALGGHYQGGDEPRGRIRFGTQGSDKIFNIDLLKKADRSTFLHETGHYFLEVFSDIAKGESAPKDLKDDYAELLKWLGVEKPEDIGTEQHEKFARGFEAYLREGSAPAPGLKGAFNRFRDWLVRLYKDVKSLRVELSPEVRGVMDRMLASQEEIEQARRSIGYQPEEIPGISKEAAENIRSLQDQARDVAENALVKEQMKEMTEKHQEFLDKQRERITKNAREEVEQEPIHAAMKELDEGPGKSAAARAQRFLKASEKGEGADAQFETLAEIHGFKNGEDLAKRIVQAAKEGEFDKAVQDRVNAGMSQFSDLRSTDMIRQEALRQVHDEKMTELLAMEREALVKLIDQRAAGRKRRQSAAIEAKYARLQAKITLEEKPIKEAGDSAQYLVAERKAAQRVTKALAEKDFEAAAKAKREQMLSHAMAGEAMKNATEIDKVLSSLQRFQRRRNDLLEMPYGFVRQIDDLLYRTGLGEKRVEDSQTFLSIANDMAGKGEDPASIANATGLIRNAQGQWVQEGLNDLVNRINDNYYGLILPDSVTSGGVREYEAMTLMDLRDLHTAVKTLAAIGTKHDRFLSAFEGVDIKKAALEFRESVAKNFGTPRAKDLLPGSPYATKTGELLAKLQEVPSRFERVLDTMLTLCHKFDGLEEGPAKKYIYRLLSEAENRRLERTRTKMEELESIFAKHYDVDEFAKYKDKGSGIELGGQTFTRENILAMALNWGNEGNRQRLRDGFQFSDETFRRAFSVLDKKDWDFVQATWDHIQKYWPEIVKLEMDVNGVQPEGVEHTPFQNEHGDYRGGYYPIAYDFTKSVEAHQNNLQRDALFKQYSTVVASTAQGHAQARVSWVKRPVRLSLDVLQQHHEDVIHDLEYRRAVIDVRRFIANRDVKQAIALAIGTDGYSAVNKWLVAAAGGGSEPLTAGDKLAQWLRFRTTFFNLAFRIVSAPKIAVENVVNLSSELGLSGAARALKDYYLGESGLHETIIGKSEFMNHRTQHLDRDMGDLYDKWKGDQSSTVAGQALDQVSPGLGAKTESFAFFVHAYLDQTISFPLWADVYKRSLAESAGDETLAVHQADEAVKRTFMTGSRIDIPQIMRGSEKQKIWTTAYGYQNMMWNRFSMQRFEANQAWIRGDRLAASALMARSFLYTFAMPAVTAALTRAIMRNAQSEANDEEKQKRFVATLLEEGTPLKFVPVLRDIAPYMIKKSMGEHANNIAANPLEESVQTLFDPFGEFGAHVFQGSRLPDKWPEHVANSLSLVTGVPKEMNDMMFNFIDWQGGEGGPTWRDVFSRRTKK